MRVHELCPAPGARHSRKRVGRGDGSGHGTYSGRGLKGQKSRSGGGVRPSFEGGQLPLVKRLPEKRGFYNRFRVEYSVVSIAGLSRFSEGTVITPQLLKEHGMIKTLKKPVKILGDGEVKQPVTVQVHRFSRSARLKLEAGGGKAEEIEYAKAQ
ncbi:MAG: 50S ribosomal protein L15 [Dehalococcoidia bacterium]|nr:50S ribosomal protein L15 [Dehalococcoidia bacterium]MDP7239701.1 50S ribosomal protein L15 [Dehalococcoidia bacterium]MDP7469909.1 50S ribosomal protein L15 [Dehalococcoidia bacterium]